jgi:hypothetical protein
MTQQARKHLARRHVERATSEDAIDWAVTELVAGLDSHSLRILAGLDKPVNPWEVDSLLSRTFDELNWAMPTREECLRDYPRDVAGEILSGKLPATDGCHEIYRAVVALGYPADLRNWMYFDDELDAGTYAELSGPKLDAAIRREAVALLQGDVRPAQPDIPATTPSGPPRPWWHRVRRWLGRH